MSSMTYPTRCSEHDWHKENFPQVYRLTAPPITQPQYPHSLYSKNTRISPFLFFFNTFYICSRPDGSIHEWSSKHNYLEPWFPTSSPDANKGRLGSSVRSLKVIRMIFFFMLKSALKAEATPLTNILFSLLTLSIRVKKWKLLHIFHEPGFKTMNKKKNWTWNYILFRFK